MNKNLIDTSMMKEAARQAFTGIKKTLGKETDPDLATYNQLKPSDFPKIIERFGLDNALSYIKAMETRRMRGLNAGR